MERNQIEGCVQLSAQLLGLLPPAVLAGTAEGRSRSLVVVASTGDANAGEEWADVAAAVGHLLWELRADRGGVSAVRVSSGLRRLLQEIDDGCEPSQAWAAAIHPEDRRAVRAHFDRAVRAGKSELVYRLVGQDGDIRVLDSQIVALSLADGEVVLRGATRPRVQR